MKTRVLEYNLGICGLGPLIGEVFTLVSTKDIKHICWPARVSVFDSPCFCKTSDVLWFVFGAAGLLLPTKYRETHWCPIANPSALCEGRTNI